MHQMMLFIVCLLSSSTHSMEVKRLTRDQLLERRRNLEYTEYKKELEQRLTDKTELNALYRSNEKYDVVSSCSVVIPEEPFIELLIRKNFPDLLEQALDKMPIEDCSDAYNSAFRESLRKNNLRIIQLLIDRKVNLNSIHARQPDEATPLMLLVYTMTFFLKDINSSFQGSAHDVIQLMKLLLRHGANPNLTVAGKNPLSVVVQQIKSIDLREQDKLQLMKSIVEVVMMGGADHEKSIDSFPDAVHVAKPLDYACDELRSIMSGCAQHRNDLFHATKDGDGINLINVSLDQPIKDIFGNNLLFHALKNKNIKAGTRLLCYFPELLSQHNFTGEFVWDDTNALESLLAIFGLKQIEEIHE